MSTMIKNTVIATMLLVPMVISEEMSQAEIDKATQNPLTAMYRVPIQNNTYFNIGPKK